MGVASEKVQLGYDTVHINCLLPTWSDPGQTG